MKRKFGNFLVVAAIVGIVLSLVGVSLVSQAAPVEKQQDQNREAPKPIPAANIEIVKKVFSEDMEKGKGKPSPSKPEGGAATGVITQPLPKGANKYAIVIGICDYPGTNLDLCQSDGDSLHMYKALTKLYGYKPENIRLLKDSGGVTGPALNNAVYGIPTRGNIYNAIMNIRDKATANDEVVFFFSGHGTKGTAMDRDDELTDEGIVVWNTEDDIANNITYIWDGELRDWFGIINNTPFPTARIAFVFDSCLAGGMNDVADSGRVISMATGETQSAYVYSTAGEDVDENGIPDGEGVFSRLFVNEGMLQGKADKYDHGYRTNSETLGKDVVVEEAFDYAKANIPPDLKGRQKPVISDGFINDLLL